MNSQTKLNVLNQYVSGDPKTMLRDRYGNSNVISTTFIKKLEDWHRMLHDEKVLGFSKENISSLENCAKSFRFRSCQRKCEAFGQPTILC